MLCIASYMCDEFEEDVSSRKEIQSVITLQDTSDNRVGTMMETLSEWCVYIIEFIAKIFSDFISLFIS